MGAAVFGGDHAEAAGAVVVDGLYDFFVGVHHEETVVHDGVAQGLATMTVFERALGRLRY